jgi:hypothetical protein
MPLVALIAMMNLLIAFLRARSRKARTAKPKSLCVDCTFAHIQYAANGRRATSCTYNGGVRRVALDVLYCTDYRARDAVVEIRPMGFRRLQASEPVLADAASTQSVDLPVVKTRVTS